MKRLRVGLGLSGLVIGLVLPVVPVCGRPGWAPAAAIAPDDPPARVAPGHLFDRENLVAWCIVPFDGKKRGPEARAAMLARLGFRHFAYDWRAEHVPTWDAELDALAKNQVYLDAFWCPGELNADSRRIMDLLKRRGVKAELWCMLGSSPDLKPGPAEQAKRVEAACRQLQPLAEAAAPVGCTVVLYNHGGWFGEPENQLAIIERLQGQGVTNVGMVYNLHHAQPQLGRLAATLKATMPYLRAINLDGVDQVAEPSARKILPLGQGAMDLGILRTIRASGYGGRIGILGHTDDDAEERLQDNLDGLDWLVPQLDGQPAGPKPVPKTVVPPLARHDAPPLPPADAALVARVVADARNHGDIARGANLFASSRLACLGCHKVAGQGGAVGPDLSAVGLCVPPDELVASVLWPQRTVKAGYEAVTLALHDGSEARGYERDGPPTAYALLDPATDRTTHVPREHVEARLVVGSLMPDGLLAALSTAEQRDLVRFLLALGRPDVDAAGLLARALTGGTAAPFPHDRQPLRPDLRPDWQLPVNRDRDYDFYAKQAAFFARQNPRPPLLAAFPGLDGGNQGHWGNQDETTWASARWNQTDLGTVMSGVFRGAGVTVAKAVCVRLGDRGELAVCFNPLTLNYEAAWTGGFVRFGGSRHGFLDGLLLDGAPIVRPEPILRTGLTAYHGFYRHGRQVIFAYRVGQEEILDAPTVVDGKFVRVVGPRETHPLRDLTRGAGPPRWPDAIETQGKLGTDVQTGYTVDTIEPPFANPGKSLMFFGGLDFARDGSAYLCTMQGEVWRVTGLDAGLQHVRWRRVASGLHQALGLVIHRRPRADVPADKDASGDDSLYVLGRDQITRLVDLDGDGEFDFHECKTNQYTTSTAGHDFVAGLDLDRHGWFVTASGPQGVLWIRPDFGTAEVVATGFRNPDGLGVGPDDTILIPSSEGDWVPASSLSLVRPPVRGIGGFATTRREPPPPHFGFGGPTRGEQPSLPFVQMPRGLDNSAGAPLFVADARMGPINGHWVHLSFGSGTAFLVLADRNQAVPQGAFTPLPGEFRSGSHRGRINPSDGYLYVAGMNGWGSYTPTDGSFGRIRPTGQPARLPVGYQTYDDGVVVNFSDPVDPSWAADPMHHLAQAWNYRYGPGYGSPEYSPRHPGVVAHDQWPIRSARVLADGRSLFLEIPDLQPVNVLHLHLGIDPIGPPVDLFATVHSLGSSFLPDSPRKAVQPDPIVADLAALAAPKAPKNPWARSIPGARTLAIEAGKNLSFSPRTLTAHAGEPIRLVFTNPDVVPHNWALIQPETLNQVGDLANKLIAQPDAARLGYIPATDAVLAYTPLTEPGTESAIFFRVPTRVGRYPFLCTFPGHWMVMNGELIVE